MNVKDTLFAYSEWLDAQSLMVGTEESNDHRSHDDLVDDFLDQMIFVEATEKEQPTLGFGAQVVASMQVPKQRIVKDQPQG